MNAVHPTYLKRINKVIDYVNAHLSKSFSLDELAKVALFSPFHFHRIFVAVTGESVNYFTNRVRLERATKLLRFSDKTMTDIAMDCGYSSAAVFSRVFKKYYDLSPSAYRSKGELQNSKIRKELFPLNEYLEPISIQKLQELYPVTIRRFPERKIAYIRVRDAYSEGVVLAAFEKMIAWAKTHNYYETETIFGMSLDDPMVTPKEKYRYEVGITLPEEVDIEETDIEFMTLPSYDYACTVVSGNINRVATVTNYLFNNWLINSGHEPEHHYGMEIFLDKENICNWTHYDLELCIPVKPL